MKKSILFIAFVLLACFIFLPACAACRSDTPDTERNDSLGKVVEGKELTASTETKEDAEELAKLYGIELVSYSYGVAVFHTDEDPNAVIARGKENNWQELSLNRRSGLFRR